MAPASSRTHYTLLGSSSMVAVVMMLAYWTSAASFSSISDVCLQDPRPHNESVWNDRPTDVNVTILWTVESVIYTS